MGWNWGGRKNEKPATKICKETNSLKSTEIFLWWKQHLCKQIKKSIDQSKYCYHPIYRAYFSIMNTEWELVDTGLNNWFKYMRLLIIGTCRWMNEWKIVDILAQCQWTVHFWHKRGNTPLICEADNGLFGILNKKIFYNILDLFLKIRTKNKVHTFSFSLH